MHVLNHKAPIAMKSYQCHFCGRFIYAGETYHRWTHKRDGTDYAWVSCQHCEAMIRECDLWDYDTGEGIGPDTFGEFEPRDIFGLRCKVMWGRGWRRKTNGSLYPVPVRAALEKAPARRIPYDEMRRLCGLDPAAKAYCAKRDM